MQKSYKATVIISIYRNIKALRSVLESLKMQSEQSFEIIISEDAQHAEVAEFCANYDFKHDYQHLTQEDCGWRKNLALNRAIRAAKSDYLILVDGDCVLHPRFVEQHLRLASTKGVVAGKRVKLNDELSAQILEDASRYKYIERSLKGMLLSGRHKGCQFVEEGIFVDPPSLLGGVVSSVRRMRNIKGCNLSFSKEAIYAINGFDEDYTLPAVGEDIDLTWRFEGVGYNLVSARNFAVQYHINHKENWNDATENERKMADKVAAKAFICRNGLVKG